MDDLFSLEDLSFWTLGEPSLGGNSVVFRGLGEASSKSIDFPTDLINSDDVPDSDFFGKDSFNHFSTQIVDRLHIGCL